MKTDPADSTTNFPPPRQIVQWQRALLWHGVGFLTLLVLTWCDALFDLMHYLLGYPPSVDDMGEVIAKTSIIIFLWIGSAYKLYQIVSRLSYLENFLRVCAWCRRIQHQEMWLSLEDHIQQHTGGKVSHGVCPECAARFRQESGGLPAK